MTDTQFRASIVAIVALTCIINAYFTGKRVAYEEVTRLINEQRIK